MLYIIYFQSAEIDSAENHSVLSTPGIPTKGIKAPQIGAFMKSSYSLAKLTEDLSGGMIGAMRLFPLAVAFGIYSLFGTTAGIMAALVGAALTPLISGRGGQLYSCSCLLFVFINDLSLRHGLSTAVLACAVSGILLLILSLFGERLYSGFAEAPQSVVRGFLLGVTAIMFVFQVTNYFEIGAVGITPLEVLKSYPVVGFHANWKTVLFSTIMLVVLITYPFKFKKASKIIPPAFLGVLITTALNFLLNPDVLDTNVPELGDLDFSVSALPDTSVPFSVVYVLLGGASMAILIIVESVLHNNNSVKPLTRSDTVAVGVTNTMLPFLGSVPVAASVKGQKKGTCFMGIFSSLFMLMFILAFSKLIARMPTSALATVLVLEMWCSVGWKEVAGVFRSGALPAVVFIAVAVCAFIFDLSLLTPCCAVICAAVMLLRKAKPEASKA